MYKLTIIRYSNPVPTVFGGDNSSIDTLFLERK